MFAKMAKEEASLSEHPLIKVGAVLVGDRVHTASNNSRGHAEYNVLHEAQGSTLYVYPVHPCVSCVSKAAKAGVKRIVVYYNPNAAPAQRPQTVADSFKAMQIYKIDCEVIEEHHD